MPYNKYRNQSDRDDYYPQDEMPYRQPDYQGRPYYRHIGPHIESRRGPSLASRDYFTDDLVGLGAMGDFRSRNHLLGSDYSESYKRSLDSYNDLYGREDYRGRGPKGYQRSDERIREEVSEALFHHPSIDASEIEIEVKEGVVTLTGEVDSRRTKRIAEEAIEAIRGVRDISMNLSINHNFFDRAKELRVNDDTDSKH
jgi:osmotically-inducible protein OsmY